MHLRTRRPLAAALIAVAAAVLSAGPAAPASAATRSAAPAAVTPVAALDLNRYSGSWRQIADIPQFYEALCVKDVTATYAVKPDGTVKVTNTCTGPFGLPIRIVGTARVLDPTSNAALQVSFLSVLGKPVFVDRSPNYLVIGVAPDYSWAVVGDPDRSTAYILSRTATMSSRSLTAAKQVLSDNGYDPCALTVTRRTGGASKPGPLC